MPGILIDEKLCNRCNTCSTVCITKIIEKGAESSFPTIPESNREGCLKCGHCEAFCPQKALTLDFLVEEKSKTTQPVDYIEPQNLALHIKKRRSIRHFSSEPVQKDVIAQVIDIARYAASGGNSQEVKWLVIHDSNKVKQIAGLTIEWMNTIKNTTHPLANYLQPILSMWDNGIDLISNNAPHLLFAHLPSAYSMVDPTDAIIAMTHVDIAAPSFGVGTCWAGFIKMAADAYKPLQDALSLPEGRKIAHAMMLGYSSYKVISIPRRNPVDIIWS